MTASFPLVKREVREGPPAGALARTGRRATRYRTSTVVAIRRISSHFLPGWYTWSKMPPSAKWVFWAWVQLPATVSRVKSLMLGNCEANLRANVSFDGR
jgi:hypothetical protein